MGLAANIRRDIKFAGGLFRLLKRIKPITLDSDVLAFGDLHRDAAGFTGRGGDGAVHVTVRSGAADEVDRVEEQGGVQR